MNSATFQRIYASELRRSGSAPIAYARATTLFGFLLALSQQRREGHRFPERTYKRHKASLRRAGIAPILSADQLAELGADLGAPDRESLACLVRHLNADRRWKPSVSRVLVERAELLDQARQLAASRLLD